MAVRLCPFSGEAEVREMAALSRASAADLLHVTGLPYRLSSWAFDFPHNVALWRDPDGRLVGWAVMQTPFWTVDYACIYDAGNDLHLQVLAWADGRADAIRGTASGRPAWFVAAFADQAARIRDLEGAGFASQADVGPDSWSKVWMRRSAAELLPACAPPDGFTMRPLAGESEVEAYVALQRAVFESDNMTVPWRLRTLQQPKYIPELDLVAVAPDGHMVAFCICWLDTLRQPPAGQVEPMGVHPDFRGIGLGRALLVKGLRRLHGVGAESVYVETDNTRNAALALYQSVGFRVIRDVLMFRKDYPGRPD